MEKMMIVSALKLKRKTKDILTLQHDQILSEDKNCKENCLKTNLQLDIFEKFNSNAYVQLYNTKHWLQSREPEKSTSFRLLNERSSHTQRQFRMKSYHPFRMHCIALDLTWPSNFGICRQKKYQWNSVKSCESSVINDYVLYKISKTEVILTF